MAKSYPPCTFATIDFLLVGDSGVGKTALFKRYQDPKFRGDPESSTSIQLAVISEGQQSHGHKYEMHLYDTPGDESLRQDVADQFIFRNVILFVFDVTNAESFRSINIWLQLAERNRLKEKSVKVLLANKVDLKSQRQITQEEASALAQKLGMHYVEASAKKDTTFKEAMGNLSGIVMKQYLQEEHNRRGQEACAVM